ncbi:MAG: PucR family transcriptional regulator ligand-binding domain-containing protein, partial [Armatimonadetes bacterium]|nr:PucR family transcriptional regulator ligand-binding domain-containing protein [Anaerolineae bacterium]
MEDLTGTLNDPLNRVTVDDVRKLALPLGTRILVGEGMLQRPVAWTTVIYPEDSTVTKTLQLNEIVLFAPAETNGARLTTDVDVVRWASDAKASALVISDTLSPTALAEAKAYSIPVLVLPTGSRARMVEKAIISLLVDRKGQLERRGTQIYRQLTQISSRNEGMAEIVNTIARLTGKSVVVQDKRLRLLYSTIQPQFVGYWDEVEVFLRKVDNLPVEFQDRLRVSESDQPVLMQSLPTPGLARLVSPIVTKDIGRGYLSILGRDNDLDDVDALVTEHGAAACALEMAKAKAISETEKRLRGTFLDRLLIGDVSQQEAVRQGERFDHDMTNTHMAIVLTWQHNEKQMPSMRRLETVANTVISSLRTKALVWLREREQEVLVFHATDPANPIDHSTKFAQAIGNEMHRQYPQSRVAIGLGQPVRDISGWRGSYRD